ncbi:MAG TPA: EAL domain-containing protein [Polyangia bacterium]|jgi:diguanylate cyclase (GGDEF)-like protein|nr:EAL domain-containing protein [Polyangia bacterium]
MAKTILVIEDDDAIRQNVMTVLRSTGYEPLGAPNGRAGLELAQAARPQLIICDIMMPDLDGYGVLQALRSDPETAGIPFIFLTAKADPLEVRQGMNLGADDYLAKPFRLSELMEVVKVRFQRIEAVAKSLQVRVQQAEDQIRHAAHHDAVTNLPNRLLLREQFDQARARAEASGRSTAVMVVVMDRFHSVTDGQEPAFIEELMRALSRTLTATIGERGFIAHLHADQFAILLPLLASKDVACEVAQQIVDALTVPHLVAGQKTFLSGSVGIALHPSDGDNIDVLVKQATRAMVQAVQSGGNSYQLAVRPPMRAFNTVLELETNLREAVEREELELHYQPQVSLKTGHIVGAEALVRWRNAQRGYIYPSEFIPAAEESGLIMALGEWVLRTACTQALRWQERGHPLRIGINISGRQFKQRNLVTTLGRILTQSGISPRLVDLEITESVMVNDIDSVVAVLKSVRALGVHISMDDFGTGYSSLSYLSRLPLDHLKVDQSFVRRVYERPQNASIVAAIIQMAHSIGLSVIAEGVESTEELDFLVRQGCDEIQGYLFSKPLPLKDFETLLAENRYLPVASTG